MKRESALRNSEGARKRIRVGRVEVSVVDRTARLGSPRSKMKGRVPVIAVPRTADTALGQLLERVRAGV
jgi:hypothetical protein